MVQEKVVTVEKVVEVPAQAKPTQILRAWTVWWGWRGPGANGERAVPLKELVDMWNERGTNTPVILEPPPPTTEAMKKAGSQGGIWEAKIIAATAAGQQPDFVDPNLHQSHEFGDVGIAVDQAPMVKQDKEYAATLDDFFPYLLETSYWKGQAVEPAPDLGRRPPVHQPGPRAASGIAAAKAGLHLGRFGGVLQDAPDLPWSRAKKPTSGPSVMPTTG